MALNNDVSKSTELLQQSAFHGNAEEVKRLIPVSNPKADVSWALCVAADEGHEECVEMLVPVSDVEAATRILKQDIGNEFAVALIERVVVELERKSLSDAIGLDASIEQAPSRKRKM